MQKFNTKETTIYLQAEMQRNAMPNKTIDNNNVLKNINDNIFFSKKVSMQTMNNNKRLIINMSKYFVIRRLYLLICMFSPFSVYIIPSFDIGVFWRESFL